LTPASTISPIIRMAATPLFITWNIQSRIVKTATASTLRAAESSPDGRGAARIAKATMTASNKPNHWFFFIADHL